MEKKENPYVSVLAKKLRGLRKKLDRIKALEEQQAGGKVCVRGVIWAVGFVCGGCWSVDVRLKPLPCLNRPT